MNKFWPTIAVLGLLALTANACLLWAILHRMPQPLITWGEYRQTATMPDRQALHDRLPLVETFANINQPVSVKVEGQPVEVRVVR